MMWSSSKTHLSPVHLGSPLANQSRMGRVNFHNRRATSSLRSSRLQAIECNSIAPRVSVLIGCKNNQGGSDLITLTYTCPLPPCHLQAFGAEVGCYRKRIDLSDLSVKRLRANSWSQASWPCL